MKKFLILCMVLLFVLTGCGNKNEKEKIKCNDGYHLKDNVCTKIKSSSDVIISYGCPKNYIYNEEKNTCTLNETLDAKIDNPCTDGYTFTDGKCVKTIETKQSIVESCLIGTSNGTMCVQKTVRQAKVNNKCQVGFYDESSDKCKVKNFGLDNCTWAKRTKTGFTWIEGSHDCYYDSSSPIPTKEYYCDFGTLEGTNCIEIAEVNITKTKTCPPDYYASGDICVKEEVTEVIGQYYCDAGYKLNGTKCEKTTIHDAQKSYSCEIGYELIDGKCLMFERTAS